MASEHYNKFVDEAFLDPIRSVLIVDDQYPTYDEVLRHRESLRSEQEYDSEKNWRQDPKRIRSVIRRFRENSPPLLVDIHDGENVDTESETAVAKHLHQSDLLVLDYNLEGVADAGGARAIDILRRLCENDHFNLVVIYTNEDIDVVFDNVRWGLLTPKPRQGSEDHNRMRDLIEEAESKSPRLYERLRKSIDSEQYFHSRRHPATYEREMGRGFQPYSVFRDLCEEAAIAFEHRKSILSYFLDLCESDHFEQMNTTGKDDGLTWSGDASAMWIKGKSHFICFSTKSDDDDLLNELRLALYDWNPHPSRLFLMKLRGVMDERGVVAQSKGLVPKHALAYWYNQLMGADETERRWHVAESVVRHSDNLLGTILPEVEEFALRLIEADASSGDAWQRCRDHFDVDFAKEEEKALATLEHNAFVCSKERVGWHLTTGHVFSMEDQLWLCLSPACDMVPSQLSKWRLEKIGDHLPFIAIRLYFRSHSTLPKDINSNRYVFLRLNEKVKIYCFNEPSRSDSAPRWETLHAEGAGRFAEGGFEFSVWRAQKSEAVEESGEQSRDLVLKRHRATVVSQLRYEYALNLIQKLGVSLTRVGLGYSDRMN